MRPLLTLAAVVTLAVAIGVIPGLLAVAAPARAAQSPPACSSGTDSASALTENLPSGLALRVLADEAVAAFPPYADNLLLTLRQLTLAPGAATDVRRTQGPLLFYVVSGEAGLSVNGRLQPLPAGTAAAVETGQHYSLQNDGPAPAVLRRVALVPPGTETTVSRGEIAQVIDDGIESSASADVVSSELLIRADVPGMNGGRLFLACLAWSDPAADAGAAFAGPIGLLVQDGQLLIGDAGQIESGGCTVFPAQSPRRLRAGTPPPTVLVFGALPAAGSLWLPAAASAASTSDSPQRLDYDCGEPPPPAAASVTGAAPGSEPAPFGM